MWSRYFRYLVVICCLTVSGFSAEAQTNPVKLRFKVADKEVTGKFRIIFYINGAAIEPAVKNGLFNLPDFKAQEKVDIRFIGGKHDLQLNEVATAMLYNFEGELIFGVKNRPFKAEEIPSWKKPDQELMTIYYLELSPKGAESSRLNYYTFIGTGLRVQD